MESVKKPKTRQANSIKWSFILYIPVSVVIAYVGSYEIGMFSNYLQDYYGRSPSDLHEVLHGAETHAVIFFDNYGYSILNEMGTNIGSWVINYGQLILIPLWVLFTFLMTGALFYKRKLEKPIKILMDASEKIADNRLDFQIDYDKKNELGSLCQSFEKMRSVLYQNNQEMWRMLEERKNLNAAFSHDMRTPITVLKGYRDLLAKYVPSGEMSEEKVIEILRMMGSQIDRLENYTQKMNALQKLEDIIPERKETDFEKFAEKCREIGNILAGDLQTAFVAEAEPSSHQTDIWVDEELILEVYENLLSNAVRYAKSKLDIYIGTTKDVFILSVEDDGKGFTEAVLRQAAKPFYRGEQGTEKQEEKFHFGVGLYICKTICEKCHGELLIENGERGGKVTAVFGDISGKKL